MSGRHVATIFGTMNMSGNIGAALFPAEPTGAMVYAMIAAEAFAGGAMLTMIAETMLPEAFEQGGSIIGLSTLAGFLVTLLVKVI